METLEKKINISLIKSDIKNLVEKQKYYRNQIKVVNIIGERKMPAKLAAYEHNMNGHKLRLMYAAYGLLRGKGFSRTENHYPEETHPLKQYQFDIDKIIVKYVLNE